MTGEKQHARIDWTIIIVSVVMCFSFGVVEVIEANSISTDEFRRWFGSMAAGVAAVVSYKYLRKQ